MSRPRTRRSQDGPDLPRRGPPVPQGLSGLPEPAPGATNGFFPLAVGARIGEELTVLGHLASGRVGHLYQVWHGSEWNAFGCKLLAPSRRMDRSAAASLRKEIRVLRTCRHPGIVSGFGGGEHQGLPYVLMEYVEGPTLLEVLESRPERRLEVAEALRSALHVGAALHHLHARGWLHLDVKPANVLLRGGVPVLVDLDSARRPSRVRPARRVGTAPYMAPEQAAREALGPAADVYGLGALLYELLTGRWPFEDALERSGREGRHGARSPEREHWPQLDRDPPAPLRRFRPDVRRGVEAVVARALAPEPEDRFPDMRALLDALLREMEGPAALWPPGLPTGRLTGRTGPGRRRARGA